MKLIAEGIFATDYTDELLIFTDLKGKSIWEGEAPAEPFLNQ
jgi:hypothetical protein